MPYRLKNSFTSGEVSPRAYSRTDLDRYKNGCRKLRNAICASQGPAFMRSGTKFLFDLSSLDIHPTTPQFRLIPFIFNEDQSYVLIFFKDSADDIQLVFGTDTGLIVYGTPAPTECPTGTPISPAVTAGDVVSLTMPSGWDIETFDIFPRLSSNGSQIQVRVIRKLVHHILN